MRGEINLLQETEEVFYRYGYSWQDIKWIGSHSKNFAHKDVEISVQNFVEIARETNYDSGYGSEEICTDLVIVMTDGAWFTRASYDGAEWWEYHCIPRRPNNKVVTKNLKTSYESVRLVDNLEK